MNDTDVSGLNWREECNWAGCNSVDAFRPPTLSCVKCSNGADCPWGHSIEDAKPCREMVPYNSVEQCYSDARGEGDAMNVTRGCVVDSDYYDGVPTAIKTCSEDGCNVENALFSQCYQCRDGENCQEPKICSSNYSYNQRGCSTKIQSNFHQIGKMNEN